MDSPLARRTLVALVSILGACATEAAPRQGQPGSPCVRPAPRSPDSLTVIPDVAPPCILVFEETGVQLLPDSAGERPDPGRRVVRDSRGIHYSANATGFRATIAVWAADGAYLQTIGGPGEGPGELSTRGALSLYMDSRDRLHVRDGGISWSVFAPSFAFERKVPLARGGTTGQTVVLDDGTILMSDAASTGGGKVFRVMAIDTMDLPASSGPRVLAAVTAIREFGEVDAAKVAAGARAERPIAYAGGTTFWAGPGAWDGTGYTLQEWSTDGRLLRTIRRDVPWFPVGAKPPERVREGQPPSNTPPAPAFGQMHLDADGLLITFIGVPNERWRPVQGSFAEEEAAEEDMFDAVLEVIDTRASVLLASERMLVADALRRIAHWFFSSQASGYRVDETPLGLPVVKILDYRLVAR